MFFAFVLPVEKLIQEIDKKKNGYYDGLETRKLEMNLVANRLQELKS